jgi:hypothetical protein
MLRVFRRLKILSTDLGTSGRFSCTLSIADRQTISLASSTGVSIYLYSDCHKNIGLPFCRFVWLGTWIDKRHKLIENSLQRNDTLLSGFLPSIYRLTHFLYYLFLIAFS